MEDEVFAPMHPVVPDLSCPPPGWAGGVKYRGRAQEVGGHPTRVIRRTDLRSKISGGQRHNNKPPRFSNPTDGPSVDRRASWGEEWRADKEVAEGRDDTDSGGEGEWKQVKGRRWNTGKEESKKSAGHKTSPRSSHTTPEPPGGAKPARSYRKSPPGLSRRSPDQGKPPGNKSNGRRGSNSSYEGEFPSLATKQRVSPVQKSPPSATRPLNHEDLMKNIPQMFVSDLPDEQIVRDYQKRRHSDIKIRRQKEDNILLQKEILVFLKRSWLETCQELDESAHLWPPKIVYYM